MAEKLSGSIGSENVRLEYSSKASLDDIYKQLEAQTKLLEKCCGRGPGVRQTNTGGTGQGGGGTNNVQQVANAFTNRMGMVGKAFGLLGSALGTLTKFTIGAVTGLTKFAAAIGGALLDTLLGLAQAFGSLLTWSNSSESSLSGFTQGIFNLTKTITSNIPLIGGALTTLVATIEAVFQPVYQILEENINAFQELNRAGIDLGSGLMSAKTAAIQAGMTLGDFTKIVAQNSDKLAAFGGDASTGAQRFADIMGRAYRSGTGANLAKLGFTASEAAEYLTSYLDQQRALGNVQGKSNQELAEGAQSYLKELDKLARVTGMSRQEAQRALDQQRTDLSLNAKLLSLQPQAQGELKKLIAAFEKAGPAMGDALRDIVKFDGNPITEAGMALAEYAPSLVKNSQALMSGQMSAEQVLADLDKDAEKQMAALKASGAGPAQIAAMGNKFEEIRSAVAGMAGQFKNATKVSADQQKAMQDGDKALAAFKDAMTEIKNAIFGFLSGTGIFEIATEYLQGFVSMLRTGTPELTTTIRSIIDEFKRVFGISDKKEQGERAENKMLQIKDTIIKGLQSMVPYIQKLKDFWDKVVASFKQGFNEGGIWGGIKSAFGTIMSPLWQSLKETVIEFWDEYSPTVIKFLKDSFSSVMGLFGSIALDGLKKMPGLIWDGIKATLKSLWGAITGAVVGWFAGASLGGLIGGVVGSFFGPLGTAIGAQIGGIVGSWFGAIGGGIIGEGLQDVLEMLWDGIKSGWNVLTSLVTKGINGVKNIFITFVEEIQLWIAGMMKYVPGLRDKGKELEESIQKSREERAKQEAGTTPTAAGGTPSGAQTPNTGPKYIYRGDDGKIQTNYTKEELQQMVSANNEKLKDEDLRPGERRILHTKNKFYNAAIKQLEEDLANVPKGMTGGEFSGPDTGYFAKLHGDEFIINKKELEGKKIGDISLQKNVDLGLPKLEDTTNSLIQQYMVLEGQLKSLAFLRGPDDGRTYVDQSAESKKAEDSMYVMLGNLKTKLEGFGVNITQISSDFDKEVKSMFPKTDLSKFEEEDAKFSTMTENFAKSLAQDAEAKKTIDTSIKETLANIPKIFAETQNKAGVDTDKGIQGTDNKLSESMNELNNKLAALIELQSQNNKIADNQLSAVQSYSGDLFRAV